MAYTESFSAYTIQEDLISSIYIYWKRDAMDRSIRSILLIVFSDPRYTAYITKKDRLDRSDRLVGRNSDEEHF